MKPADSAGTWSSRIRRHWRTALLVVVVLTGFYLLSRAVDVKTVHALAARLNAVVAFLLLTILPLFGFPVSVLHVAAGVRFGAPLGLTLVATSILLQLLASYGLVHWRRDYFERKFHALRQRIPPGAHGAVTLFTMLLPGVPYFAKNYVLPVIGVPLRPYLLWCFPLHAARSSIAVIFGDQSDELTPGRLAIMAIYAVGISLASWWAYRRLRAQIADRPPAAGDLTPRA